jgi:2,3-bisphosphoglycerate-dependent phosphoglycerate mutase
MKKGLGVGPLSCIVLVMATAAMGQSTTESGAAAGHATPGHIFVVRHAEKESETADALSEAGKQRSACLAATLKSTSMRLVMTSEFKRTQQTATATADEFNLKVDATKSDDFKEIADKARGAAKMGDVLIVGHSNTVPQIVKALTDVDVTVGATEYDDMFVIDGKNVAELHYCPAAKPGPESRMK